MQKLILFMIGSMLLFAPHSMGSPQKAELDKGAAQKKSAGDQKQWDKSAYQKQAAKKQQFDKSASQEKTAGDQKKTSKQYGPSLKGKNGGKGYSPEIVAQKAQWVKNLGQEKTTDEMKEWLPEYDLSLEELESNQADLAEEKNSDSANQEAASKEGAYSLAAFSVIFKNDIFNANRRPGGTAPKIVKKAPPKPSISYMELTGVMIYGELAVAFFEGSSPDLSGPREKGTEILGMIIADVQADHVMLAKGDYEEQLPVGSRFGTFGDGAWGVELAPYRPLERMALASLASVKSRKGKSSNNAKKAQEWAAMSNMKKMETFKKQAESFMDSDKGRGYNVQFQQIGSQMVKMVQEPGSRGWEINVFDPAQAGGGKK